ncbi:hypothetical protein S83_062157 [Arachis hypogaea]|nr:uncharacterized protein LOC112772427 [Arachis hypogaea]QHN95610.1 uncharacterized protein DS421_18g611190 [Arachis hypogaea]
MIFINHFRHVLEIYQLTSIFNLFSHAPFSFFCVCCLNDLSFFQHTLEELVMMDSMKGGTETRTEPKQQQKQECATTFLNEGILMLLSGWHALQMAINNQWGGSNSLQKSHHLASHLFSSLSKFYALVSIEDLENLLHECMLLTFNTEIEDGSIEQVAEQLVGIHEEYLLR